MSEFVFVKIHANQFVKKNSEGKSKERHEDGKSFSSSLLMKANCTRGV